MSGRELVERLADGLRSQVQGRADDHACAGQLDGENDLKPLTRLKSSNVRTSRSPP